MHEEVDKARSCCWLYNIYGHECSRNEYAGEYVLSKNTEMGYLLTSLKWIWELSLSAVKAVSPGTKWKEKIGFSSFVIKLLENNSF